MIVVVLVGVVVESWEVLLEVEKKLGRREVETVHRVLIRLPLSYFCSQTRHFRPPLYCIVMTRIYEWKGCDIRRVSDVTGGGRPKDIGEGEGEPGATLVGMLRRLPLLGPLVQKTVERRAPCFEKCRSFVCAAVLNRCMPSPRRANLAIDVSDPPGPTLNE